MPELPKYALLRKRRTLQSIAAVTIVLLTALILYSLHQFINATLGAILVYVLAKPMMNYLTEKRNGVPTFRQSPLLYLRF